MSVVDVRWKGHCRSTEARYRLLGHLHRLALLSDGYLRMRERPASSLIGPTEMGPTEMGPTETGPAGSAIRVFDELHQGPVLVSNSIGSHPDTLVARAREAGLEVKPAEEGSATTILLDAARLRGLDFKLFDPKELFDIEVHHRGHDRMSFVFLECPEHHFLDGRLVQVTATAERLYLSCPRLQLAAYLEDWTDCLFAWIRFFLMGDFWWRRREELQGYADYRNVFEELQTSVGTLEAEDATFDAVLSTFAQHAEDRIGAVRLPAKMDFV